MRRSLILLRSPGSTTGISSTAMLYSRSAPSSNKVISILGGTAGCKSRSDMTLDEVSSIVFCKTSPLTVVPYFLSRTEIGALPSRKPGTSTVRASSFKRLVMCVSISLAATAILNCRFKPSDFVSVTCMDCSICHVSKVGCFGGRDGPWFQWRTGALVRAEGLEPPRRFRHQDLNLACLPIPPRPPLLPKHRTGRESKNH